MSNLRKYIPNAGDLYAILILVAIVALILVANFGLPSWFPGSAERKVPVLERQLDTAEDGLRVETATGKLDRTIADHTTNTINATAEERARTDAYITRIEAAPDAASRQRLLVEFVCGNRLYAADPECAPPAE